MPAPSTLLASSFRFHVELTESVSRNAAERAASRAASLPVLGWPADGALTGWWGEHRRSHIHVGIDLDGEIGDPIRAAGAGEVVHAGPAPVGYSGYGLTVVIDHGHAIETLYAHLDTIAVVPGQHVESGQFIGTMGVTGNVTGSHLHFEVRRLGIPVDPGPWLPGR